MATFIKFHLIHLSFHFFLIRCCTCIRQQETASNNEINARLVPRYLHFEFAIFNSARKDLYQVEFADDSRLKYELKAKDARRLRRPKQMTSSIAIVVIGTVIFWKSGLHAPRCTVLPIREIWTIADTKNSWFFNMAANMADLTTNFNGSFWHFLFTKSSFCLGKSYGNIIKIRYLFKF